MNVKLNNVKGVKFKALVGSAVAAILIGTVGNTGFTERHEGMILKGYKDPIGIPTKCAGDTYNVVLDKVYTYGECMESLDSQLYNHALPVLKCLPSIKGNEHFLAAAIDHNYHMGNFCSSSMKRLHAAGDDKTACIRYNEGSMGRPQYIYVKDKFIDGKWTYRSLPGLVKRAGERRAMCERGLVK
jgi:lysozyme